MGHHWQWTRPMLYQYQHLNPCLGCLRCSDGCRRSVGAANMVVAAQPNGPAIRQRLRIVCANGMGTHNSQPLANGRVVSLEKGAFDPVVSTKCTNYSYNEPPGERCAVLVCCALCRTSPSSPLKLYVSSSCRLGFASVMVHALSSRPSCCSYFCLLLVVLPPSFLA